MTAQQSADTTPDARTSRASPQPGGRRRTAVRQVVHAVLFVALAAGVFGLLPRLAGRHRKRHPLTPGGLGVMEVTLVTITVGFGAPRATAVLAILGCRVVNYWLPLLPGAVACLRLRLSLKAADAAEPSTPRPGEEKLAAISPLELDIGRRCPF